MMKQTLNTTKTIVKRLLSVTGPEESLDGDDGAAEGYVDAKKSNAAPSYQYLALVIVYPVIAVGLAAYVL